MPKFEKLPKCQDFIRWSTGYFKVTLLQLCCWYCGPFLKQSQTDKPMIACLFFSWKPSLLAFLKSLKCLKSLTPANLLCNWRTLISLKKQNCYMLTKLKMTLLVMLLLTNWRDPMQSHLLGQRSSRKVFSSLSLRCCQNSLRGSPLGSAVLRFASIF